MTTFLYWWYVQFDKTLQELSSDLQYDVNTEWKGDYGVVSLQIAWYDVKYFTPLFLQILRRNSIIMLIYCHTKRVFLLKYSTLNSVKSHFGYLDFQSLCGVHVWSGKT